MRRKGIGQVVGIAVVAIGATIVTLAGDIRPVLGLDLQGGVSVVLQPVKAGKKATKVSQEALEQTQAIIETRVNAIGVAEPEIAIQGDTIVVQLPGVENQKRVLALVGKTAELRFRPVLETPAAAPPKDAKATIAKLRKQLAIPDGVTATQIFQDEVAKSQVSATDENGQPISIDPNATGVTGATGTSGATGSSGDSIDATTGASGEGTGGRNAAKVAGIRGQDATTTTAPAEATTTTAAPTGTTTTTTPAPKNQWGIDINSSDFGTLYQLEQQVSSSEAEVTKPEDDVADKPVVLLGRPEENGQRQKYKLGPSLLTGRAVEDASAGLLQNGGWAVNPSFREGKTGIDLFNAAAAKCNSGAAECPATAQSDDGGSVGALAIVLDGEVISAPAINEASFSRDQIQITGSFDRESANDLALALRYGALPLELETQQVQRVSATLGTGALRAGLIAGAVGLGLVVLYLLAYYRILGAITVASLVLSGGLMWTIIAMFGEWQGLSLTLAGIVGIIVSVGVSLDSSIVYFENLKEDVHNGRSLRSVAGASFSGAFGTIAKANTSSLIGAVVLYLLSIGPVKGFAFYLAISTVLDMFMAYFFIRPATVLAAKSSFGRKPGWFGIPVAVAPEGGDS